VLGCIFVFLLLLLVVGVGNCVLYCTVPVVADELGVTLFAVFGISVVYIVVVAVVDIVVLMLVD